MANEHEKKRALINSQKELRTRIANTCNNIDIACQNSQMTAALVKSELALLETKWAKFEAQHERLQCEYDHFWGENFGELDSCNFITKVDLAYTQQRAKLFEYEQKFSGQPVVGDGKPVKTESVTSCSMLPPIQLQQFSGRLEDWPAFRDLFLSVVVKETLTKKPLSKIEKLYYLKTSVTGDAEQLIYNLLPIEENFDRAWATLTSHFDKK